MPDTYRYAMTAPYYVQIGEQPRISKSAATFFLDWVNQRAAKVRVEDDAQRAAVKKNWEQARAYWQDLVTRANAP